MAKRDYSNFQQGVIRRYYENREQIDEGKLSELVTSLYLAESKSARDKLWDRVESLLERLDVLPSRIEHVSHKLKGSLGVFEFDGGVEAAGALESMGRSGDLSSSEAAYDLLADRVGKLATALNAK